MKALVVDELTALTEDDLAGMDRREDVAAVVRERDGRFGPVW